MCDEYVELMAGKDVREARRVAHVDRQRSRTAFALQRLERCRVAPDCEHLVPRCRQRNRDRAADTARRAGDKCSAAGSSHLLLLMCRRLAPATTGRAVTFF